jgi:hypothetical protein
MENYQLAQINIAKLVSPIDSPPIADFVADLDRVNQLAERSKGFIWRLKDETGNATQINPFNDTLLIVNISVWESVEDLKQFVYRSDHVEVYIKRAKWFEKMQEAYMALWWIEAGNFPSAEDGKERLMYLREHGESNYVFSFKKIFDSPAETDKKSNS